MDSNLEEAYQKHLNKGGLSCLNVKYVESLFPKKILSKITVYQSVRIVNRKVQRLRLDLAAVSLIKLALLDLPEGTSTAFLFSMCTK